MKRARVVAVLLAVAASCAMAVPPAAPEETFAAECAAPGEPLELTVGAVDCVRLDSAALGGVTAFSYYIPPACAGGPCPVLYLLHGAGGSYRGLGAQGTADSVYVRALTSGPAVDPRTVADPWRYADPDTWVPKEPIDAIYVAPEGNTIPGGHGPAPGGSTGFVDWNPRYAAGGDTPRYPTPSPRMRAHLVDELVPFVDAAFATIPHRRGRVLFGASLGGFGAFAVGLQHPDMWASIGMISGFAFPFPDADLDVDPPVSYAPPADAGHVRPPGVLGAAAPAVGWTNPDVHRETFGYPAMYALGWGDPVADHMWYRGNSAVSLARNARAYGAGGEQSIHLRYFHNDGVPRRPEDVTANPIELVQLPMNLVLEDAFDRADVEREFDLHPGMHGGDYRNVWIRDQLEGHYRRIAHLDGTGDPPPDPTTFDYRTTDARAEVWGWTFAVERRASEFLNLTGVSCDGFTVRGTGRVTVTVPASCSTGLDGRSTFEVDLGPGHVTDEPAGAGGSAAYGRTVHVTLTPTA